MGVTGSLKGYPGKEKNDPVGFAPVATAQDVGTSGLPTVQVPDVGHASALSQRTVWRRGCLMRGVFQKSGKGLAWWIRWTCPQGHRHEEKVGPKAVAQSLVEKRRVAVKVDGFCLTAKRQAHTTGAPLTFRDVVTAYLAWSARERPRSLTFRRSILTACLQAFGDLPASDITPQRLEQYLTTRQHAGATGATVNRDRSVLSHLFGQLVSQGVLLTNPLATVARRRESPEQPRPLTHDEEARLFCVLPVRFEPAATFALHTGLRLGEIRAQAWRDVDLDTATLTVTAPKSGQREVLPLNSTATELLRRLPKDGPAVFPMLPADFSRIFARIARAINLDVTFHCLRDTFISRLAPHVSGPVLMQLARHRDFRTTRRYLKVDGAHLREAVERLTPDALIPQPSEPSLA